MKKQTDFLNNDSDKKLLSDISKSLLSKEQLKNWMWKYAIEVQDSDNIVGLHIDSNFKEYLADNLLKKYY